MGHSSPSTPPSGVFHKVVDRLAPVSYTKNIPIPYLAMFDETGHSVFDDAFSQPSLLDHPRLTKFLHHAYAPPGPERDQRTFEAALSHIRNAETPGSVLLTLVEVDSCSHWQGVGSEPYNVLLAENDRYIRELTQAFKAREPDGAVFVVSDHGMSNIERTLALGLEEEFGPPGAGTYAYFSEATILRIWTEDAELRRRIADHLDGIRGLRLCDAEERRANGITRPEFGDLIYYTDEGVQIVPSFWGPKPSVGMHGHHARHPGQHGICLTTELDAFPDTLTAKDFYHVLAARFTD